MLEILFFIGQVKFAVIICRVIAKEKVLAKIFIDLVTIFHEIPGTK